ncbi:hypothetical protein G6F43_013455 [Rhizopus delemar]|nr:hypothetical protein G6F43_013455 [Rhizopus delemar]
MSNNHYNGGEAPMASSVSSSSVHTARPDLWGEGEDVPNPSFDITNTQAQVPGIPTDYPTPMAVQAPNDEEMEQVVNHMKFIYDKMMFYVTKTKPAKLQELQSLASSAG